MSIYNPLINAINAKDIDKVMGLYADDYAFVRHQTNSTMSKADMRAQFEYMMASDKFKTSAQRCLYENEEVLVIHQFIDFPDGSREALLMMHTLRMERLFEPKQAQHHFQFNECGWLHNFVYKR